MAIDKVISSLPLEFRGSDPVSMLVEHNLVTSYNPESTSQRRDGH
jgi:hypothetical protein